MFSCTYDNNCGYQEDRYIISIPSKRKKDKEKDKEKDKDNEKDKEKDEIEKNNIILIGVFDGHGGNKISHYVSKNISKYFIEKNKYNTPSNTQKYCNYIKLVYKDITKNLLNNKYSMTQGSTSCLCILFKYKDVNYICTSWLGDSRAIARDDFGNVIELSRDHKPNDIKERERIEKLGGKVTKMNGDVYRVNGSLAVSRSFGDFEEKEYISAEPEINITENKYTYIVVATDGLWDVMTNKQVINYIDNEMKKGIEVPKKNNINNGIDKEDGINIAQKLVKLAVERGSTDNITVIINFMK